MRVIDGPKEFLNIIGEELGQSEWLQIDQERVNKFADATNDQQWIHIDPQRAKDGPFGACIAHGYLTQSLASYFLGSVFQVTKVAMGVNYGVNKVRFPAPVVVGAKVRGVVQVIDAEKVKGCIQVINRVTIEIEGSEKPACVVDTITRYFPE